MGSSKITAMPGFRFHPTEQELVGFYLRRMVEGKGNPHDFIPKIDLYLYEPWELRGKAARMCEKELFFFVPRESKFPNGGRPNRRTKLGYWKATGTDRQVRASIEDPTNYVALKKTLVYYRGRAPTGTKTNWIMNEYRLSNGDCTPQDIQGTFEGTITLCRIYLKDVPLRLGAARHDLEAQAEIHEAYHPGSRKFFLHRANTQESSTRKCYKCEDIDSRLPSPFRRIHESKATPVPPRSHTSEQNCLSYTSNWPQSNGGAQDLALQGKKFELRGACASEGTPSSSCISNELSYDIAENQEHVVERKSSTVLTGSDLARCLDYTYTDIHLEVKDLQEIELWPALYTDPMVQE